MSIQVEQGKCSGCGACLDACTSDAISLEKGKAVIDQTLCAQCEACIGVCPLGALHSEVDNVQIAPAVEQPTAVRTNISTSPKPYPTTPWPGAMLSFPGQGIFPRLVNVAASVLESRVESQSNEPASNNSEVYMFNREMLARGNAGRGQGRGRGAGQGHGHGRGGGNKPGSGPSGDCVCPKCGKKVMKGTAPKWSSPCAIERKT